MNYLVGKIGKGIVFNPDNWSAIGGDMDAPTLFTELAKTYPEHNFYIISSAMDYKNTIPNLLPLYIDKSPKFTPIDYLNDKLKDVRIDGILLMTGPTSVINIPNTFYTIETVDTTKVIYKCLDVFKIYAGQIYKFLNDSKLPWLMIANDPRYIKQGRDLLNPPVKCLSQFDEDVYYDKCNSYEDQHRTKHCIKCEYSGIEKLFLLTNEIVNKPKTVKFGIILNDGKTNNKTRYDELKKYILDYFEDIEIYGKWTDERTLNDKRFKGPKNFTELRPYIQSVKYTFIISIKKGWVTSKYIEMISQGCIPFFHPEYDTQKHCDVPDFLRVKSPKELRDKIDLLESDNKMYEDLLTDCQNRLRKFNKKEFLDNILAQVPMCNKPGKNLETVNNNIEEW